MSDLNPSPEFEEKVRRALEAPEAKPEFVQRLRKELVGRPVKMKPKFILRPAWVIVAVLLLLAMIASAPAAVKALKKLFGYVPGVGLVDNSSGMRTLVEPVSVTRDGATLTVTQALVYPDHVQLIYEVSGIAPENDWNYAEDGATNFPAFCGSSPDGDAKLRLPDGTLVERTLDTNKYPENIFATKPAFEIALPADVTEMTIVLKCLPWARLGAVPENWEVPLKLVYVPAGTVIGEAVLEVTPSEASMVSSQGFTVTLDKVVPQQDFYSFYFTIVPDQPNDKVLAYFPASAYVVDATGQKISLVYMQPFTGSHDVAEPWELQSVAKPAYGPYTLVLDQVETYYNEDGSNFFEFDAGPNPQVGQTWDINQTLHLAGTDVRVLTATMAEKDLSMFGGSANTQGYVFTFGAVDGKTPFSLDIMDRDLDHISGGIFPINDSLSNSYDQYVLGLFYEKRIPAGKLSIAVNGQTITTKGHWEFQWTSPDQTGEELLSAAEPVSSAAGVSGVTVELHRVVKTNDGYLFFVHMTMPEQTPDFRVVEPVDVSVVDATGKEIKLNLDGPQVYGARDANLWQFSTTEPIAPGPLELVVDNARVYYSNFNFETPPPDDVYQQIVAEHSFIFDAGADPQVDQTWTLNQEFETGGYHGIVKSVRAVTVDPKLLPFPELRPDASINRGYEFTIEAVDPSVRWNVNLFMGSPNGETDCIGGMDGEAGSVTTHTVSCRGLSSGNLEVDIIEISVWLNERWQVNMTIP